MAWRYFITYDCTIGDPLATANPLHAPLMPLLYAVLAGDSVPPAGVVLDLAGGEGDKLPLLRAVYGDAITIITLDQQRWGANNPHRSLAHPLTADAHKLPLRSVCLDRLICIAAFGSFADQQVVLRETYRVLKPGGRMLIVSATQQWVHVTPWPQMALAAFRQRAARQHIPAVPDIADQLDIPLYHAGFKQVYTRAFLLDEADPFAAEMALLPWPRLAPLLAAQLDAATLDVCVRCADMADVELSSIVVAAWAER